VVVVLPDLVELDPQSFLRERLRREREVLPVLPAGGVARVGGRVDRQEARPPGVLRQLPRDVREEGVPVAVAPHQRHVVAAGGQLVRQRRQQCAVLVVDGRLPAEAVVVLAHLDEPLVGDPPTGRHVLEEGQHVLVLLRSAEGHEDDCVEWCKV
jgi:hypothetical protein